MYFLKSKRINAFLYTNQCIFVYDKFPKISYSKVADKMAYANNADPERAV